MKRRIASALVGGLVIMGLSSLWAQKQMAPKSQKELEALQAVQSAKTPDDRIKAIENVLTNFADTDFKNLLLQTAMQDASQKGDYAQIVFYGERLLESDPKNAFAYVTLAGETARRTRENDLDKEEQLAKADKWAKAGIEAAKSMPKPRPDITDQQWDAATKDMQSQGYVAIAMGAALRKKYDDAIAAYKQALAVQATPDSTIFVRMGQAYLDSGQLDDATASFDKALNDPSAPASVKQIAQSKKDEVAKKKAAGTKPPGNL